MEKGIARRDFYFRQRNGARAAACESRGQCKLIQRGEESDGKRKYLPLSSGIVKRAFRQLSAMKKKDISSPLLKSKKKMRHFARKKYSVEGETKIRRRLKASSRLEKGGGGGWRITREKEETSPFLGIWGLGKRHCR